MKIPNISLGFSNKKYSHNLSRDCNTTFPFGVVQPIFSQFLLPDSDISVDSVNVVRLAPLVAPSFARISLRTVTRFVPESDVVRWSDAFYSQQSYRGRVPSRHPVINNPTLLSYVLQLSNFCVYRVSNHIATPYAHFSDVPAAAFTSLKKLFFSSSNVSDELLTELDFDAGYFIEPSSNDALRPCPSPGSCDYLVYSSQYTLFCFNFTQRSKNLRNICIGLGYSLELDDFTSVKVAPLLAFYKAYYDTYGLTRFKSFTETSCFKFIELIDLNNSYDFSYDSPVFFSSGLYSILNGFLIDLGNCYYSTQQDFISIHRSNLQNSSSGSLNVISSTGASLPIYAAGRNSDPTIHFDSSKLDANNAISNVSLRALQVLSRFVNKQSILGKKVSDFMRLHYGASSVETIFQDSNFIDSSSLPCNISDVFSTSDTAQGVGTDATGEHLGAYAGKGIGRGQLKFKFHTSCHGYVITLASIVPDAGYFQGTSPDLFAVTWEQQPNPTFDALGMEVTPRSAFVSNNNISIRSFNSVNNLTDKSFGYVPRYSSFKFAKNVVNGDMSRRGSLDSMSPYYLDHILSTIFVDAEPYNDSGAFKLTSWNNVIPSASYDWRYVCKYPWLGNFSRIFVNEVGILNKGTSPNLPAVDYNKLCIDDGFLCQCIFNCTVRNSLKPLSLSYDTFDESVDNASTDVNPS